MFAQDDIMYCNLTVEENLLFSARYRLPVHYTHAQHVYYVERAIQVSPTHAHLLRPPNPIILEEGCLMYCWVGLVPNSACAIFTRQMIDHGTGQVDTKMAQ